MSLRFWTEARLPNGGDRHAQCLGEIGMVHRVEKEVRGFFKVHICIPIDNMYCVNDSAYMFLGQAL